MANDARSQSWILWFDEISMQDVQLVGGKNASLGEMVRNLGSRGVRVPGGFAITAAAYRHFLASAGLETALQKHLQGLDTHNIPALQQRGQLLRQAILDAQLPNALVRAIDAAYGKISGGVAAGVDVAVRSSATAEDLPDASFAGQQETFLNVRGLTGLLDACKRCFASLYTDRAIAYRVDKGFEHRQIAISVGVQRMVRSDLASSGVMFSLDTESGFRDVVLINAAYGLGENVVQGTINPDEYTVFKPTLEAGFRPILRKCLGTKELKLVYEVGGTRTVRNIPTPAEDRLRFALSDDDVLTLARWACEIEKHYSAQRGVPTPMDMEWAKDGITGELFIVQARPETVQSRRPVEEVETYRLGSESRVLVTGHAVGERIGTGRVRVLKNASQMAELKEGEVLVTEKTDPDWEPVMKRAAAIVTNRGGRTCHAAIVSRELGLPALVGTENATMVLKDGGWVTVSCAQGEVGRVYEGKLPFSVERTSIKEIARPHTKVMLIVADPAEAFKLSFLPNDGVGLAREEFIINHAVGVHPLALVHFDQVKDPTVRVAIEKLTHNHPDKTRFFVESLAQGVATLAAAFFPKDVILRFSDFKTNEYANLLGGAAFEPVEENPMIGFRGASRYYHPRYAAGFALECQAIKMVRDEMGLRNLKVMVPFCRTVAEGRRVLAEMARHGLVRGEHGLEVYVMCEIPSNVILADDFAEIFDGFSIGSNDLTQLTLGVDRDSEIVAPLFDERNPAVTRLISQAIRSAKQRGRKIGICGQAPSDYPDFARFLVEQGIDSISLNPDVVMKATMNILLAERVSRTPA